MSISMRFIVLFSLNNFVRFVRIEGVTNAAIDHPCPQGLLKKYSLRGNSVLGIAKGTGHV